MRSHGESFYSDRIQIILWTIERVGNRDLRFLFMCPYFKRCRNLQIRIRLEIFVFAMGKNSVSSKFWVPVDKTSLIGFMASFLECHCPGI